MPDLFNNNVSNDYINPGLASCANLSDSYQFKFLPNKEIGIVNGSNTIMSFSLSDIAIDVTAWNQRLETVSSGEVIFIEGMTKGLMQRKQYFDITYTPYDEDLDKYYMQIDLSVFYYRNFRYTGLNVCASANYDSDLDIATSINLVLSTNSLGITMSYDPSLFTFTGTTAGFDYDVSNFKLTLYDASLISGSPITHGDPSIFNLTNSITADIPYAMYPNSAMLGIFMKVYYPTTASDYEKFIDINHVPSLLTYYEESAPNTYSKISKIVDVGMSGTSTSTKISAGDYLAYVTDSSLWTKIGDLYCITSAPDLSGSATYNLVPGFYVYNPHTFSVQVEYMQFV
jgi:hypothetical protein